MSDNQSSNSDRLSGVSVRVNGVVHGAGAHYDNAYHVAGKIEPTVRYGGGPNEVSTYVPFDERNVGDLSTVVPFADSHEMHSAFRDPRYKTSAAFRLEVGRRSLAMRRAQQG